MLLIRAVAGRRMFKTTSFCAENLAPDPSTARQEVVMLLGLVASGRSEESHQQHDSTLLMIQHPLAKAASRVFRCFLADSADPLAYKTPEISGKRAACALKNDFVTGQSSNGKG